MIKFNKHRVVDTETKLKARVFYSINDRNNDGRKCITLYAKDYNKDLSKIFPNEYQNNSDLISSYCEGRLNYLRIILCMRQQLAHRLKQCAYANSKSRK